MLLHWQYYLPLEEKKLQEPSLNNDEDEDEDLRPDFTKNFRRLNEIFECLKTLPEIATNTFGALDSLAREIRYKYNELRAL